MQQPEGQKESVLETHSQLCLHGTLVHPLHCVEQPGSNLQN